MTDIDEIKAEEECWNEGYDEGWSDAILECAKRVCALCACGSVPIEKHDTLKHRIANSEEGTEYYEECRASEMFMLDAKP